MLTLTGEYALRAVVHMAGKEEGRFYLARDLAEETQIPPAYLAKILQALAREDLLISQRGLKGGFRFARPIHEITLADVIGAIENLERFEQCILGQVECNDQVACPLHHGWRRLSALYLEWLKNTKLSDLVKR